MKLNRLRWTMVALPAKAVRAEEDRRAKDPLECGYQPAILLSAGVHSEALQHFRRGSESDGLTFLLHRQVRQEDRNEPVLPVRHSEFGMAGDLKEEPPVPSLVEELILWQAPDRQSTEDERPGAETQILVPLLALDPDYLDAADTFQFLFGDEEVGVFELKYLGSGRHPRRAVAIGRGRKWTRQSGLPWLSSGPTKTRL